MQLSVGQGSRAASSVQQSFPQERGAPCSPGYRSSRLQRSSNVRTSSQRTAHCICPGATSLTLMASAGGRQEEGGEERGIETAQHADQKGAQGRQAGGQARRCASSRTNLGRAVELGKAGGVGEHDGAVGEQQDSVAGKHKVLLVCRRRRRRRRRRERGRSQVKKRLAVALRRQQSMRQARGSAGRRARERPHMRAGRPAGASAGRRPPAACF